MAYVVTVGLDARGREPTNGTADDHDYWAKRVVHDAYAEPARLHPDLTIVEGMARVTTCSPMSPRVR
ncbi:hypothetical protein [Streptomyces coffeae]|uniref:Uncharacterized protein n=1 Tax=Streptomyces coffeae TaxID=621382 RepID=A0ABS1NH13_9ACTN|nr:hypothetical protein [Streptomyces coffeae]MBL1099205.1 hypothetical protein [Streptomyces coffeae]